MESNEDRAEAESDGALYVNPASEVLERGRFAVLLSVTSAKRRRMLAFAGAVSTLEPSVHTAPTKAERLMGSVEEGRHIIKGRCHSQ